MESWPPWRSVIFAGCGAGLVGGGRAFPRGFALAKPFAGKVAGQFPVHARLHRSQLLLVVRPLKKEG